MPEPARDRWLILRLSALGDVINALPVLYALRRAKPTAFLGWCVEDRAADLVTSQKAVDRVHVFPRRRWSRALRHPVGALRVVREAAGYFREIRAAGYTTLLDLQGNLKSGLHGLLTGVPDRIGFVRGLEVEGNHFFTTRHLVPEVASRNRLEKNLGLLRVLGIPFDPAAPAYIPPETEGAIVESWLTAHDIASGQVVIFSPGASRLWRDKRWPTACYAELGDRLSASHGLTPFVFWGPGERPLAEAVAAGMHRRALVADEPWPLPRLAALAARARLFVGSDSAPLHLVGLMRVPSVALFGPTDPDLFNPPGGMSLVARSAVPYPHPTRRILRRNPSPRSMPALTVEEVLRVAERALAMRQP
ncbi:MAG: glycosyltransferase family 9 protein [Planctomycetes bacterium]|nr:glycosyltransferase family 9 protein [Planctomycetota bacterium]